MYDWKLETPHTLYQGRSRTLNDALDSMVKYANGKTERDFHVNGHNMNEEFDLWIDGGKVIHDNGTELVATNEWYEKLGGAKPAMGEADVLAEVFPAVFSPQPTRGLAPTNPATRRDGDAA